MKPRHIATGSAICAIALFGAPAALADAPTPGSPVSDPYYSPPGTVSAIPGNFTFSGTFEWIRPRRQVDSAGIAAMTNADPSGSGFGMPGSHLGIEPQRYGPNGATTGPRASVPQQATSSAQSAGGILPGASVAGGLEDPAGQAPKKPIVPESAQPDGTVATALPDSTDSGPDPAPPADTFSDEPSSD
ncbi:conserved hypothetical protein [Segniliparus rotundus DSM 44985]|uniref:Uncharacterized protein n=1 Tax=Segniliparus rotundus (strain ATCC BAA-972 / CDC 1076 / CIP 108378 / DSM 44985 / JCM 13578) TaxID=640132 RepID=D6Z7Y7_SEGRD|nr:hypothetical protein [Segniliparus rotundus]ADG98067.1 conserved hypothetical protein [Segniliparus rotundus DSM 44985]